MLDASKKIGCVTISSTDTEVVSNGKRFPKHTWFRCFRIGQDEYLEEDLLF